MKAIGRFAKKNGKIFRTSAELQWGQSEKLLGIFVLLNPEAAKLKNKKDEKLLRVGNDEVEGELVVDSTMRQIEKIVNGIYVDKGPNGKVLIYNLCSLQEPKSDEIISKFNKLWDNQEPLVINLPRERGELIEQAREAEWLLFGWGIDCRKNHRLFKQMEAWHEIARETKTPILGKRYGTPYCYYHIKPRFIEEQEEYRSHIVDQYRSLPRRIDGQSMVVRFPPTAAGPNILLDKSDDPRRMNGGRITNEHGILLLRDWHGPYLIPPSKICQYSQLSPKQGIIMIRYEYDEGRYSRSSRTYAVPENTPIEIVECECVKNQDIYSNIRYLPRPVAALPNMMDAIEGDGSPLSYLQVANFGGATDKILPYANKQHRKIDFEKVTEWEKWDMHEEEPAIWDPHFYIANDGKPIVIIYRHSPYMPARIFKDIYRFSDEGYQCNVFSTLIASNSYGILVD